MRRKARTDANQTAIVEYARKIGLSVHITSSLGGGFPDLAIGYGGITVIAEVKDGDKPPSKRKLTDGEQAFKDNWTGGYYLIERPEDVLRLKYALMRWRDAICTLP